MSAIMQKIENREPLYYGDIRNLVNDYDSDTACRVKPVLSCLRALCRQLTAGAEYQFHDQCGVVRIINLGSFHEFILKYFNEKVYCDICGGNIPRESAKPVRIDFMAFRKKLGTDDILAYEDISALIDVYKNDAASDRLIRTLCVMYDYLDEGKTYCYYDISGTLNTLTKDNFKDFVIRFTDGEIYRLVSNEIRANHCR